MRLKKLLIYLTVIALCVPAFANTTGENVTSTQLIDQAKEWDGKIIEYSGETIGDILDRKEYAWVSVLDDSNTISCYTKIQDTTKITTLGKYGVMGDKVKVTGIFNRACSEHGGDMDIHTQELTVLEQGYNNTPKQFSNSFLAISIGMLVVAGLLIYLVFRKAK